MSNEENTRVILGVVESNSKLWYYELIEVPGNDYPVGNVYTISNENKIGEIPELSLQTTDELSTIWCSPEGSIWVGSSNGFVATTSNFNWENKTVKTYKSIDKNCRWSSTELPKLISNGLPPNITVLWGLNDNYVFAGTYHGHIYLWNGFEWLQSYDASENKSGTIKSFAGISNNQVVAIGQNGCLLNFNGENWNLVNVEEKNNGRENFTGIHAYENGYFIISGNGTNGRILKGKINNLVEICRTPIQLVDLVVLNERILFVTDAGVAELFGKEVQIIKSNFIPTKACSGINKVFFINPTFEKPNIIIHNPEPTDRPWCRNTF